jgi:hypothetical protein
MRSAISTSGAIARRRNVSRVAAIVSGQQTVAEPLDFPIERLLRYDRLQYPIGSSDSACGISASSNILFTQLTPSVAQSRRRLAAER